MAAGPVALSRAQIPLRLCFCLVFFRHYATFFRKFTDSIKGYPLHFFEVFGFLEFFGIVRLKKIQFFAKVSNTCSLNIFEP